MTPRFTAGATGSLAHWPWRLILDMPHTRDTRALRQLPQPRRRDVRPPDLSHVPHPPPGMPGNTASVLDIHWKTGGFITEENEESGYEGTQKRSLPDPPIQLSKTEPQPFSAARSQEVLVLPPPQNSSLLASRTSIRTPVLFF